MSNSEAHSAIFAEMAAAVSVSTVSSLRRLQGGTCFKNMGPVEFSQYHCAHHPHLPAAAGWSSTHEDLQEALMELQWLTLHLQMAFRGPAHIAVTHECPTLMGLR